MARIKLVEQNEATGAEKERYDELAGRNAVTNMKKGLLNDAATYDAYMAWYTSWNRLVEVIGEKDAILFAHKISTTNSCQLCSLFFISDVKGLGLDPANLVYDEKETGLTDTDMATIKDIAEKLNISPGTVSKGLNGAKDIIAEMIFWLSFKMNTRQGCILVLTHLMLVAYTTRVTD